MIIEHDAGLIRELTSGVVGLYLARSSPLASLMGS